MSISEILVISTDRESHTRRLLTNQEDLANSWRQAALDNIQIIQVWKETESDILASYRLVLDDTWETHHYVKHGRLP